MKYRGEMARRSRGPVIDQRPAIAVPGVCAILHSMQQIQISVTPCPTLRVFLSILCGLLVFSCFSGKAASAASPGKPSEPGTENASSRPIDSYTIAQRGDSFRVNISYPRIGNSVADAELSIWAREQAAAFTDSVQMIPVPSPVPYELFITYESVRASSQVISLIFFISTSMGGPHPESGLATFVYDKRDGRRLSYGDLFMNSDGLLPVFSDICRKSLAQQLGDRIVTDMLEAGTAPEVTNFDLFVLTPSGLRIYFPPYQAAPYSEGYLTVAVPLTELEAFKPQLTFWDAN